MVGLSAGSEASTAKGRTSASVRSLRGVSYMYLLDSLFNIILDEIYYSSQ